MGVCENASSSARRSTLNAMRAGFPVALVLAAASACSIAGLDDYASGGDAGNDAGLDAPKDVTSLPDQVAPDSSSTDSGSDVVIPPACNLAAPFGAAAPLTSLNSSVIDGSALLSPDELTILFTSNRLGAGLNVFTAARANKSAAFGAAAPLASLNFGGADTWNVALTGDGLTAYFVTDQNAADHMYVATRASSLAGFGTPKLMPVPIVSGEQPFVTPDGKALYYTDQLTGPKYQIARAALGATPTVAAVPISVPSMDVGIPVLNPTETLMYFTVFDHTNFLSYDIWTAKRATANDAWSAPTAVAELNTSGFEGPSWISPDGCALYFTRALSGSNWDMYVARKP